MAITNIWNDIAVARVVDAAFKVSGGTQTDLAEVTDVKATPEWSSVEGKAEGAVFAVSTKLVKATLSVGTMTLNTKSLALLCGSTAPAVTGTTPSLIQTTNFKVTDLAPYFAFGMKSMDITGIGTLTATDGLPADCHIIFPKCKLTKLTDIVPGVEDYATVKIEFEAIPDANGILFTIVENQTTAAIALT